MRLFTTVLAVSASLILSGCVATSPSAESSPVREASILRDIRVCFTNDTAMNMRILYKAFSGTGPLPPGSSNCNTDVDMPWKNPLVGTIQYEPVLYPGTWLTWNFNVSNERLVPPVVTIWYIGGGEKWGMCPLMNEGQTKMMQSSWTRFEVTRLDDTDSFKEFTVRMVPPFGPDNPYRRCA